MTSHWYLHSKWSSLAFLSLIVLASKSHLSSWYSSPNLFVEATSPRESMTEDERKRTRNERRRRNAQEARDPYTNPPGQQDETSDVSYFLTPKPRDVFEGTKFAIFNVLRGGFYGIAALIGSPISMAATEGLIGFLKGVVAGVVLGVGMPLAGMTVAVFQLIRGFMAQPYAFKDGFIDCKIWNETDQSWEEYNLDDDLVAVKQELEDEEKKSNHRRNHGNQNGYKSSNKVKSTEYYDMLGVQPDATPSEIRSAYRKRARLVHPDKNPDDEEAETKFRELSAAYQTLSDPSTRKQYDASGVKVDPKQAGGHAEFSLDPFVFFAVLFGSEQVENYVGELGLASSFDAFIKLAMMGDGSTITFDSWDDLKSLLGWSETALKRRKRETDIAIFLRQRVSDYVEGYLTPDAFLESCRVEAESIANGGSFGVSFLSAIGPALVTEADLFLGYRKSFIGMWRGPLSGVRRNVLIMRRKIAFVKAIMLTVKEGLKALYESAEVLPDDTPSYEQPRGTNSRKSNKPQKMKPQKVQFESKDKLKDNFSNTIPSIINMAWAINFVDISNTLSSACTKLFHDSSVSSKKERLRRAEAIHILGSQFHLVAMEITGGNTTLTADIDDIKARATTAFSESMKKGMKKENNRDRGSDEM